MNKIAFFLPSLADGGAERVMLNIANEMVTHDDVSVDLVLVSKSGPYLSQVDPRINIIDLGKTRILFALSAMSRYLREAQPDAVLSALDTTNLVLIWAKLITRSKTRTVVSVHCNLTEALKGAKNLRASALPYLMGAFYKFADAVVAVSHGVANDLCKATRLRIEDITVLVNPVITPDLIDKLAQPSEDSGVENSEVPIVLGIGRLTYQKDFFNLVQAFALVKQEIDAKLVILGDGEDRPALESMVADLGLEDCVTFKGFVQNPYRYMKSADVFALSSRYEGLPTVLIEALYAGASIVSTNCPSGPSEILENGELGKLVPVEDARKLADAIIATITNPGRPTPKEKLDQYMLKSVVKSYRGVLLN